MTQKRDKIKLLILGTALVLFFLIYNLSGLFFAYDVTHPSETEAMYFSDSVIEKQDYKEGLLLNIDTEKY